MNTSWVVCNTASVISDVIPWYKPQNSECQKGNIKFRTKDPTILTATLENLVIWDSYTSALVGFEIHLWKSTYTGLIWGSWSDFDEDSCLLRYHTMNTGTQVP